VPSALPTFRRPPKRSRLLCMRPRLRNPSLWPRVGVSFYVAKYVATTKRDLDNECRSTSRSAAGPIPSNFAISSHLALGRLRFCIDCHRGLVSLFRIRSFPIGILDGKPDASCRILPSSRRTMRILMLTASDPAAEVRLRGLVIRYRALAERAKREAKSRPFITD
jgi:hypothetical protein